MLLCDRTSDLKLVLVKVNDARKWLFMQRFILYKLGEHAI